MLKDKDGRRRAYCWKCGSHRWVDHKGKCKTCGRFALKKPKNKNGERKAF